VIERAAFGGYTRAELAALKPRARPESAQELAAAAARSNAAAAGISASDLAVASSRAPLGRPRNIADIVAEAERQADEAEATVQTASASATAVRAAPAIPTRASVARQATITNAISLRRVNLIGVFGTPSDRNALVRLANGRIVRVGVGDRVDGGQVAAIGEDALRYVKNGRNVVLELPDS